MNVLTPLAVANGDVLRLLAAADCPPTAKAFAERVGRFANNLPRTFATLEEAGLVDAVRPVPAITETGRTALAAIERAEAPADAGAPGIAMLRHAQVAPHPLNPRKDFQSDEALEALDTLRESIITRGLRQNLVVRAEPDANGVRWIVSGERRWRAIGNAIGDGDLPADFPIPCKLVEQVSDEDHALDALAENMLRRDLSPIEEARAFKALVGRGVKTIEIADQVGRTQKHVQDRIKLLELSAEDQARMSLPKDDPAYLSYTDARHLVQEHRPAVEAARVAASPEPTPAAPIAAAARADLSPAQALVLFEVDAAIRARPELKAPLGPATRIKSYAYPSRDPIVASLVGEGMLHLNERDSPNVVTLLRPGQQWLATAPGAFMEADYRLQMARRGAGLDDIAIAGLEAEGEFATAWLNVPAPPKPREFTPAEALTLLEIWSVGGQHDGAEVAFDLDPAVVEPFKTAGLITGPNRRYDGRWIVRVEWSTREGLQAAYPGAETAAKRDRHIAKLRELVLGAEEAKALGDRMATVWLNGPFELSPEAAAKAAEDEARDAREAEARRQRENALEALDRAINAFEQGAADYTPEERAERLGELLTMCNAGAPWRPPLNRQPYEGVMAESTSGAAVKINGSPRTQRLIRIAINMATGVPPSEWPAPEPAALGREAFEAALAAACLALADDEEWALADAQRAVGRFLPEHLADEGIEFGDPGYDWTAAAARILVEEFEVYPLPADDAEQVERA